MQTEFDQFAAGYADLLHDPIRVKFAPDSRFFTERKLILIRDYFRRSREETRTLAWLDVGCGQGDLLRQGRPHFATVAGCDPSVSMLAACQDLPVWSQESADRLPFSSGTFDLVTAVCVYHHIDPTLRATVTEEAWRVLKPGGVYCVIEHNPLNPITRLIVSRTPVDADAKLLGASHARRLLHMAGLWPVETRYFLYFPERIYSWLARGEDRLAALPLGGQYVVFGRKPL